MAIRSIAVFCGSKSGNNPLFEAHTRELGHLLAANSITIIYGGGNKGLMAAVANADLEKKGKVIGIIPKILSRLEHQHCRLTELRVRETIHICKIHIYNTYNGEINLPDV